ncbi:Uncharacterised protein g5780 [Pycnogonum litorale]
MDDITLPPNSEFEECGKEHSTITLPPNSEFEEEQEECGKEHSTSASMGSVDGQVKVKISTLFFEESDQVYKMNSNPRGQCLLINIVDFNNGPTKHDLCDRRDGSDIDAERMEYLFKDLGFKVEHLRNLTGQEIEQKAMEFTQKPEHAEADAAVVCIMSHGRHGDDILGSDGEYIKLVKIIELFNNCNCPSLKEKPKIFLIQACRGAATDFGVTRDLRADSNPTDYDVNDDTNADKMIKDEKLPSWSDILVAFSSSPGFESYRHEIFGSWFMQTVYRVFAERACESHIAEMLTQVSNEVANRTTADGLKQGVQVKFNTWRKNLYFNPGHPRDDVDVDDDDEMMMMTSE